MNKRPTISFYGSSLVSSYWNGAATYYRGIIKYLNRLGYEITFFEPDAFERQQHIDLPHPPWAKSEVYENNREAADAAVEKGKNADVLIKASGVGVFDAFLEKALLEVRKPGQTVIFWDVDAPATLQSVLDNEEAPFRELIPQYDAIFTYGGGKPVVDVYKFLGAAECTPIYNAFDPDTHFRVDSNPKFECTLAFLGNRLPDREERVKQFFIQVAAKLPDKKFILGGNGWQKTELPENIEHTGHVYTTDHNAFNSSPLAVLNISRNSMAEYGFSPATRVFEAAGAAACIITDYWEGIDHFFEPETEILVAKNGGDVYAILEQLTEEKARKTGELALKRALRSHTYQQRAEQVDKILYRQKTTVLNK